MKTQVVILAGGEGTRLSILTAKRAKPAVPFAGKYRIIDFPLSNCVNSNLFDVTIVVQYRPHSLITHIGAGGPWDLNREFSGGIRIFTPYRARSTAAGWFVGTADAVQQNFGFIKRGDPDFFLILSGDHVYSMDYVDFIQYHLDHEADLTMATIEVPIQEASRFGIVGHDDIYRVTSFVEKPEHPPSNLANMGVYLFSKKLLDEALWEDHLHKDSTHDFGKDILPAMINKGARVFAYPYDGYWVDVGTVNSYWQAHMDLLLDPPSLNLHNRSWVIHTRTEERSPIRIHSGALIEESMISDGCIIEKGARVSRSILSPGVIVKAGASIDESIIFTDTIVDGGAGVVRAIIDKRVHIGEHSTVGGLLSGELDVALVGKDSVVPSNVIIQPGGVIGTSVIPSDYPSVIVKSGEYIQTRRLPNEI